jgi:glutamyl-tRNA reductase
MVSGLVQSLSAPSYEPGLFVTGVSFRTLSVEWRERLAKVAPTPESIGDSIVKRGMAREAAVLSTCNRFEIVSVGGDGGGIKAFFESLLGVSKDLGDALYQYSDASAVRHIYRVSSSLDSMVLGEAQILGQVKRAYQQAVQTGSVGAHLHHLFQSAFNVAKKVHSHTEISAHGVSLSYVAVQLARQIFADLADVTVVVVGSGEMAELAVLHLCSQGCSKIVVANRTLERAASLAERFSGLAVSLSDLDRVIDGADIVIGSISIDRPIISAAMIKRRRSTRPLFLIDLGVPRNFAADLANIDNVYLYNIDDLSNVATSNMELREAAAKDAEMVIEYGLAQFERWRRKIAVQPELIDLRQAVERICAEGVAEALPGSLKGIGDNLAQEISHLISQKISHELTRLLERQKGVDGGGMGDTEVSPFLLVPVVKKSED